MPNCDAEFDRYDDNYQELVENSMSFSGMSHDYVTRIKAELIVSVAKLKYGSLENRKVLDVGCGIGLTDTFLVDQPWQISGTDMSANSIERARERNPQVSYCVGDGNRLPFDDGVFDVCFTICVMHHVPPRYWNRFLREIRRVLKPGGIAVVLEHNPYNPLTRLVVNRCPFDADAVLLSKRTLRTQLELAEFKTLRTRFFLLTPWERLKFLDGILGCLPLGAQYLTIAER